MKNYLKFLPFLIIPAVMVQTSCTDASIDEPPPPKPACKLPGDVVAQDFNSTISIDVVFRDFQAARTSLNDNSAERLANTYPGFQEFDWSKSAANKQCGGNVTKGMVQENLDYTQCEGKLIGTANDPMHLRGRFCARPMPSNGVNTPCYGENLQSWYTDGPHAKTILEVMELVRLSDGHYQIKCNTANPCDGANGYYPLDKYGREENDFTWGFQGYDHNYGFTLAGSVEFQYIDTKADVIEFAGDDDMWIFIDSKLAMDVGGTHNSISDIIDIQSYGVEKGWKNGSMHVINFFYAERQTVESNLMLKIPISNIVPIDPPVEPPCP